MTEQMGIVKRDERPALLAPYDRERFNILTPISIERENAPYLTQRVAVVQLDADPEGGDCYAAPGTRWNKVGDKLLPDHVAPRKEALAKLAAGLGVIIGQPEPITPRSHRLARDMAAGLDVAAAKALFEQIRYDVAYRVVVAIRDGLDWRYQGASYEWDLDAQTRKIRREAVNAEKRARERHADVKAKLASGEWKRRPDWYTDEFSFDIEAHIADRVDQIIAERHGLAETKAINRALRSLGIKQQYRRTDFAKPFAIVRTEYTPDASDPAMQAAIREKALRSGGEIFAGASRGGEPGIASSATQPDFRRAEAEGLVREAPPVDTDEEDIIDVPPSDTAEPAAAPAREVDEAVPGPWDEPEPQPASTGPTRKELTERCVALWNRCLGLRDQGKIKMPDKPLGTDTQLADWITMTEQLIAAAEPPTQ